ncbi:lysine exporter LysO family protein [Collinsella intestinalis]|uniref:lysine exporter LysO family protein n=1 Tax=Collinsella intestinalis TaxID=147207 RepID=UPI0025A31334|nr:lysine exporter LysO family protein [Collinsella intestinalis]MDM8162611.1 lysine exporter LysO family protein [Collinsella intestinalis]
MDILIIMVVGMLAGRFAVPERFRPYNGKLQTVCTCLLIGSMGASIGSGEGFLASVAAWGGKSLVFCLIPTACSVVLVYLLTARLLDAPAPGSISSASASAGGAVAPAADPAAPAADRAGGKSKLRLPIDGMAVAALIMLALGIALGVAAPDSALVRVLGDASEPVLWVLMALVGIGVGMHRGLVASIREHHLKMLVIPAGVVVGSLVGGALAALPLGFTVREGMAAASGLGWYSLAGVTIENVAGAELGGIAFLANLMRELLSFFCIPWIARHLNGYACIAAGAATSEDTTLPMMIRYTDERCVVYSLINGVICSACVPVLIALCLG